jgi:hypothetical protein
MIKKNNKHNSLRGELHKRLLSPEELKPNSMTIMEKGVKRVWRPNNYRRQIEIKERSDSAVNLIRATIPSRLVSVANRSKLVFVKEFKGVTIMLGRNTLTAILSQNVVSGKKEHYIFSGSNVWINNKIVSLKEEFKCLLDGALNDFSVKFGLKLPFAVPKWSRFEDWTTDKNFIIDKFREDAVFFTENFKKVYGSGVEFVGGSSDEPTALLLNHLSNSALNDLQPELVKELNNINSKLHPKFNVELWCLDNLKNKFSILDHKDFLVGCGVVELEFIGSFIIEKFGEKG